MASVVLLASLCSSGRWLVAGFPPQKQHPPGRSTLRPHQNGDGRSVSWGRFPPQENHPPGRSPAPHKIMVFLLVPFRRHKMGGRLFLGDPCAKMLWLSLQKTHKIIQNGGVLLASL